LWFARYDGVTGRPLEFDRWSHCIVRTDKGLAAYDGSYASRVTRQTRPHSSTSSSSRSRPFAPDDPIGPERYSHIVYASGLPMLRSHGPHLELDIYDSDTGRIATMTVPFPGGHRSFSTLTPEPLPASR